MKKEVIAKEVLKIAKELVAANSTPVSDVNKVNNEVYNDVENASKKLRDIVQNISEYRRNPDKYFDDKNGLYKNYDEYKRAMIKALEEVKDYVDYVSKKIYDIKGKL